jgi:hypothetical protein
MNAEELIAYRRVLTDKLYVMAEESKGGFKEGTDYGAFKKELDDIQLCIKDIDSRLPWSTAIALENDFKSRITGLLGVRY